MRRHIRQIERHASRETRQAANGKDRLFFTGPTTVGNFDSITALSISATSVLHQSRRFDHGPIASTFTRQPKVSASLGKR